MPYHIHKTITQVVSEAIIVTGVNRSGTSMMGTLIHSLRDVEYAYAPPLLSSLFPLIETLPRDQWCLLYETYLFEDHHLEAVIGRRLNFNEHEKSYIYSAKERSEIEARLRNTGGKTDYFPVAAGRRLAYKLTDSMPFLSGLWHYYPRMKAIVMFRSPEGAVSSLLRQGWLSDDSLSGDAAIWPSKVPEMPFIPSWVPDEDMELWKRMPTTERCYYYYALMYDHVSETDGLLLVDYDSFIQNPRAEFDALAAAIGCEPSDKTWQLLEDVRDQGQTPITSLTDIGADLRQRVLDIAEKCQTLASRV